MKMYKNKITIMKVSSLKPWWQLKEIEIMIIDLKAPRKITRKLNIVVKSSVPPSYICMLSKSL